MECMDARSIFNKDSPTGFYTDFAVRHESVYDKDWKKRGSDSLQVGCLLSRWVVL